MVPCCFLALAGCATPPSATPEIPTQAAPQKWRVIRYESSNSSHAERVNDAVFFALKDRSLLIGVRHAVGAVYPRGFPVIDPHLVVELSSRPKREVFEGKGPSKPFAIVHLERTWGGEGVMFTFDRQASDDLELFVSRFEGIVK